jgi:TetR/AcrR family fatty acid metabolism transcriptional regulator
MRSKSSPSVRDEPSFIEAARREQIIRCATETIAELGYARASLAEIAKREGISKSVISYYFASKDELIRQIIDDVYATGRTFMTARLETQTNATDALRAYLRSNVEFMGAHRTKLLALVEIVASFRTEDGHTAFGPELGATAVTELEGLLRWGQDSGEFRAFSPPVMAITIRAAIDALPWRLAGATELELDAYAGELIDMFDLATRTPSTSQRRRTR